MKSDPPLVGLDHHAVEHQLISPGRAHHRRHLDRRVRGERRVGLLSERCDAGLIIFVARLVGVALPDVDRLIGSVPGHLPRSTSQFVGRIAGDLAKRKAVSTGKHTTQVEISSEPMIVGQPERQEARPRIGEAKLRPIACQFVLDRLLRTDLAGSEEKLRLGVWRGHGW